MSFIIGLVILVVLSFLGTAVLFVEGFKDAFDYFIELFQDTTGSTDPLINGIYVVILLIAIFLIARVIAFVQEVL